MRSTSLRTSCTYCSTIGWWECGVLWEGTWAELVSTANVLVCLSNHRDFMCKCYIMCSCDIMILHFMQCIIHIFYMHVHIHACMCDNGISTWSKLIHQARLKSCSYFVGLWLPTTCPSKQFAYFILNISIPRQQVRSVHMWDNVTHCASVKV